jgi:hypothetical protein
LVAGGTGVRIGPTPLQAQKLSLLQLRFRFA